MTNDSKRVGSKFETDVVTYLRTNNLVAERLAKAGSNDEGDIVVGSGEFIFELKARRDAKSSLSLGSWLEEARREAEHYRLARNLQSSPIPVLICKNPRKSIGKSFVVMYLEDFIDGSDTDS